MLMSAQRSLSALLQQFIQGTETDCDTFLPHHFTHDAETHERNLPLGETAAETAAENGFETLFEYSMQTENAAHKGKIEGLQTENAAHKKKIEGLQRENAAHEKKIEGLQTENAGLKRKAAHDQSDPQTDRLYECGYCKNKKWSSSLAAVSAMLLVCVAEVCCTHRTAGSGFVVIVVKQARMANQSSMLSGMS